MLKTIVPARLAFRDGVPYSAAYGDVYHSADGGPGQARHVFLGGCGLPGAWAGRDRFVVLETGFGTGLNFLTTWAAWRDDPDRPSRLHFISVEKHPFQGADLACIHAQWPEFAQLSAMLRAEWPTLVPGFHRIALDGGRVQLTLMFGDARDCLPEVEATVDAFYLDGFSPERNPDLWQPVVFDALARLAAPGALGATYSVAASVRDALSGAGFASEKRAGYGRKRHCLTATFARDSVRARPPRMPRRVAVIGAGVAGAAVAQALAARGVEVSVLERAETSALGASGNPVAVYRPVLSRDDNLASRLTRAAFLHDLRSWGGLGEDVEWSRCGVLHLAKDADAAAKQSLALRENAPPEDYARWVELDEARALANWRVESLGVFYPQAGWVVPASLCRAWLDHRLIRLRTGVAVARVERGLGGWRLLDGAGDVVAEADTVVLANARDARDLAQGEAWPLHTVRGQVSCLPRGSLPEIQRVIAREGYVAPGMAGPLVGATYDHTKGNDHDTVPRTASDRANLARLEAILPGAAARVAQQAVKGRASLRATLPDRLPLLGEVAGHPGLYVAAGYASRGVVWAGLLGETLADQMCGAPMPLERTLLRALSPARFA